MPTGPPNRPQPDPVPSLAERLIRDAMESGEFEDLPGTGRPIPGRGTTDDSGWWLREWVKRNVVDDAQDPSKSS